MPNSLTRIEHARFVVTVDPQRRMIADGSILIEGDTIVAVGKANELAERPVDRVIDAREMVVTPGFLNGHMHASYAHAVRGIFPDDVENRLAYVFQMQSVMTAQEEHDTTLLGLVELLKGGTTCFVDPGSTQHLESVLPAYEAAGVRVMTGEQVTDIENPMHLPVYDTATALRRVRDSIERYNGLLEGRVRAWVMPFSQAVCSPELLQGCDAIAAELGTMMTLHHFGGLRDGAEAGPADQLPTEQLYELGILSPRLVLSHGMNLADAEIGRIARSGAHVVMCPSTVLKGGGSIRDGGRLPELLEAGVDVALGTDSVNSSNYLDMVRAMNAAAVVYKDARRDPAQITAETALELATIRAARALGIDALVGSIEVGKRADLVLFDTRRAEWRALTNPVRNLVYSASADSVHTVLVDGRVVVEDGAATFADEWELIQWVEAHGERIRTATGVGWETDWPIE